MNEKYEDFLYVFHSTKSQRANLEKFSSKSQIKNIEIISDEKIKDHILKNQFLLYRNLARFLLKYVKEKYHQLLSIK